MLRSLLLALALAACSSSTPPQPCTPGQTRPCAVTPQPQCFEYCRSDGVWGACTCVADTGAGDVTSEPIADVLALDLPADRCEGLPACPAGSVCDPASGACNPVDAGPRDTGVDVAVEAAVDSGRDVVSEPDAGWCSDELCVRTAPMLSYGVWDMAPHCLRPEEARDPMRNGCVCRDLLPSRVVCHACSSTLGDRTSGCTSWIPPSSESVGNCFPWCSPH